MKKLKSNKISSIMVILAFVFNIIIFAPMEIFYTNRKELWFTLKDIIPIISVSAVIAFIILIIIEKLFKYNKKHIFIRIIITLTIGLYIQGNFLNFGYGKFDGSTINWNSMILKGIINTVIWIIIIIFPYCLKKLKDKENFKLFASIASIFIILIELITLSVLICTQQDTRTEEVGLSNKNIFNVSKKDNIVVFMSDTFEGTYMNQILEKEPEYKEKLKDFTYFDNCTGVSFFTFSSMPTLLTGEPCLVENSLQENLDYGFSKTDLYKVLKENNYTTELYTEEAIKPSYSGIDNLSEYNDSTTLETKANLTKTMYKYTLFRYLPHFLKSKFIVNSYDFIKLKMTDDSLDYKEKTYFLDDVAFNQELLNDGLDTNSKKNMFKFYQMVGVHFPYNITTYLQYDNSNEYSSKPKEEKRYNQEIASLNLLCNYIEELKESGAYDNTTIIFLADHGYDNRFYTTLLVKKANTQHDFEISSAPVTLLEDLVPTILNIATNSKEYGKDFFDYKEGEVRTRQVYNYTYEVNSFGKNAYKTLAKMVFQSEELASDKKSFYLVAEEYEGQNKELTEKYQFGQEINIDDIRNSKKVNCTGFALDKVDFLIPKGTNIGNKTSLIINSMQSQSDVTANFYINKVFGNSQSVEVKVNGEEVYNTKLNLFSGKNISFNIPKEIWNKEEKVIIELKFPDGELGEYYATMMAAISLKSFSFTN